MSYKNEYLDLRNEDFATGMSRLGYDSFALTTDQRMIFNQAFACAVTPKSQGVIPIHGIRNRPSPYDPDIPDSQELKFGLLSGRLERHINDEGPFSQRQEYARRSWERDRGLQRHINTPPELDAAIATARAVGGLTEATSHVMERVRTFQTSELEGLDHDINSLMAWRLTQEIRELYGTGLDREAFALAGMIPHFEDWAANQLTNRFVGGWRNSDIRHSEVPEGQVRFNIGPEFSGRYENLCGQETRTLQVRALTRIISEGMIGSEPMTDQERRRLRVLRASLVSGYSVARITAETTLDDMHRFASSANPRPDLGVPVYSRARISNIGSNIPIDAAIFYDDGSVYIGGMPTYGTNPAITLEIAEEQMAHGSVKGGTFTKTGTQGYYHRGLNEPPEDHVSLEEEFAHAYGSILGDTFAPPPVVPREKHQELVQGIRQQWGYPLELLRRWERIPHNNLMVNANTFGSYLLKLGELAADDPIQAFDTAVFGLRGPASRIYPYQFNPTSPNEYPIANTNNHFRVAFIDPDNPDVAKYFDRIRNLVRKLRGSLFYYKLVRKAELLPRHTELNDFVSGIPAAQHTPAEWAGTILKYQNTFDNDWLHAKGLIVLPEQ